VARNREFYRDKAAFGWNFLFPFLLIGGFSIIFGGAEQKDFKVGLFPCAEPSAAECVPEAMKPIRYIQYIGFGERKSGLGKLRHHKIDMLVELGERPYAYWVSNTSPKGYIVERMVAADLAEATASVLRRRPSVEAREIRYIDWLFPGILGMTIMFSALYGVGFVVVRYRKNGVLKRLSATPLTAFEYLAAQVISRILLLLITLVILWVGCDLVFEFTVEGHMANIALLFVLGCLSLCSLGLVVASRGASEEFANGILNFITWPMMFLSEVWFSIEGAPEWVKWLDKLFPLTHLLTGVRKVMNDGAGLTEIGPELAVLAGMTILFLLVGARLFSWNK
jgi:ABC-type multidrug transport system permease subunit